MTPWAQTANLRGLMSSYEESLEITCELLRRYVDESRPIQPSDDIQSDLGLDSLSVMELVSDVENRFGVSIPSEMFDQIATVEDVARVVSTLQSSHQTSAARP
jgi:acyl carrier protein